MYIFVGFVVLMFFVFFVVGIFWCIKVVDMYYVKDKKIYVYMVYNIMCFNDEIVVIVMVSLVVVDCVVIIVCGFVGMILFYFYFKFYGFKEKGER